MMKASAFGGKWTIGNRANPRMTSSASNWAREACPEKPTRRKWCHKEGKRLLTMLIPGTPLDLLWIVLAFTIGMVLMVATVMMIVGS